MTLFGYTETASKLFLPQASLDWNITDFAKKNDFDNLFLEAFSFRDSEAFDVIPAFDKTSHVYACGRDEKNNILTVELALLLNEQCKNDKNKRADLKKIRELYNKIRISKHLAPVQVTIGGSSFSCYAYRMSVQAQASRTSAYKIAINFILTGEEA